MKVILDKEPNNKQALDLYMKTTGQMEKIRLEAYEKMTRYAEILEPSEFIEIEELNAPAPQTNGTLPEPKKEEMQNKDLEEMISKIGHEGEMKERELEMRDIVERGEEEEMKRLQEERRKEKKKNKRKNKKKK